MGDALDEMLAAARARVGQEIGGKYRLDALVGVGGTAAVYAATHRNGHRVAVKVSHKKVFSSPALWARFLRESYLGNVLEHEGVVRVLDDDVTQDGAAYLVMELLSGASLRAIAAELPLDVAYVAAVGDAVLEVLAIAHQKGIVHRDVKPENIFLTKDGVLKLLDFGVARQLSNYGPAVTTTGAILGTPAFMAPEQVLGRGPLLGPPTDLWSVGATLFTLLSGQHVHEGATTGEVFVAAATRPARSLASLAPGCPAPLCAVVDRALEREIDDRWHDATAMRAALAEAFRASFGKPLDPKVLLARMAAELLPFVAGDRPEAEPTSSQAPTQAPTWSSAAPPRPDGPRANGYRELPPTLRGDVAASSPPAPGPQLVRFVPGPDSNFVPTTRVPELGPPEAKAKWRDVSLSRPFLFQDETLVSPGETLPKNRGRWLKTAGALLGLVAASAALGLGMSRARNALSMQSEQPAVALERRALLTAREGGGEADAALREAFQLWQDGAPSRAKGRFLDAARLDPARAEAHLYAFVLSEWVDSPARSQFAKASAGRQALGPRERALLEALAPLMQDVPQFDETTARLKVLVAHWPEDTWLALALTHHLVRAHRLEAAIVAADRVGAPAGRWLGAVARLKHGDEGGEALLRRCVDESPAAVDCLAGLAELAARDGRCDETERFARALIASDHGSALGYRYLAHAIMGQTHSTAATRAVLEDRWARVAPEERDEVRAGGEFFLFVHDGQFERAYEALDRWQVASARSPEAHRRMFPLMYRLELDRELGLEREAQASAQLIALSGRSSLPSEFFSMKIEAARALYLTGQSAREEFAREQRAAFEQMRSTGGYFLLPGVSWFEAYVNTVKEPADALVAVAKEPRERPLFDPLNRDLRVDALVGRAYLLAGRPHEAVPLLRRATSSCWYAESNYATQAQLWLGDALVQANDRKGACRAYDSVLARWGHEGRSATVRAARRRSSAVGCPRIAAGNKDEEAER